MDLVKYVTENALVLIPVLYVIGSILKGTEKIKDKYIPIILLPIGVALAIAIGGVSVDAVIRNTRDIGYWCNSLWKPINKTNIKTGLI